MTNQVVRERFLEIIRQLVPASALVHMDALGKLDQDKIYVENVRSVLDVPSAVAVTICETAVRQGVFKRFVAVQCPDGSEGAAAETEDALPPTVTCYAEQDDGFIHEVELPTSELRKTTFYRLPTIE